MLNKRLIDLCKGKEDLLKCIQERYDSLSDEQRKEYDDYVSNNPELKDSNLFTELNRFVRSTRKIEHFFDNNGIDVFTRSKVNYLLEMLKDDDPLAKQIMELGTINSYDLIKTVLEYTKSYPITDQQIRFLSDENYFNEFEHKLSELLISKCQEKYSDLAVRSIIGYDINKNIKLLEFLESTDKNDFSFEEITSIAYCIIHNEDFHK